MSFKEKITKKNPQIIDIPSGYKRLGDLMILRYHKKLSKKLGETIMEEFSWVKGVFQHITTTGEIRTPKLVLLAGEKNTQIVHKENKVYYVLDINKITFSGGNSGLRKRLINDVNSNEVLVDMFSAVGNLSLQPIMYKKPKRVILIEKSEYTFSFLKKTILLNKIKADLINSDCRNVNLENIADRIFMGYHNVDKTHIKAAIKIAKQEAFIHLHPLAKINNYTEWIDKYIYWFNYYNTYAKVIRVKKVKNYSPGLHHIEIVFFISKEKFY